MKFDELTPEKQQLVKSYLEAHAQDVDYRNVNVVPGDGTLHIQYKGLNIEAPIGRPSQGSCDTIWGVLVGGILALGGFFLGAKIGKSTKS